MGWRASVSNAFSRGSCTACAALAQHGFHIFEAVESFPGLEVARAPRAVFQARMHGDFVVRIVKVVVVVHPLAAIGHHQVVHRAGKRSEHEEGGVVGLDVVHEIGDVAADGFDGVEREADDVADVRADAGVAIGVDELRILGDFVLRFSGRGEIARVHAFHADENVGAAGGARFSHEVFDLPGEHVDLHHELQGNVLFVLQVRQRVEDGFPIFVAREIVVGEEIKGDSVGLVIAADGLGDVFGGAETHFAALHVDDGAEGALERTAAAAIERAEIRRDELAQIFRANHGDGLLVQIGFLIDEIVERLERALHRVAQDIAPGLFHFALHDGYSRVHQRLNV